MKRLALLAALIGAVFLCTGERATAQVSLNETPAVISVGAGWYDLIHQDDERSTSAWSIATAKTSCT